MRFTSEPLNRHFGLGVAIFLCLAVVYFAVHDEKFFSSINGRAKESKKYHIGDEGWLCRHRETQAAWNAILPVDALERGLVYRGNGCRMKSFVKKLEAGKAVVVVTLGGSVTAGGRVENRKRDAYPPLFFDWINRTFPTLSGAHQFVNGGRGGMPSSTFGMCLDDFVPRKSIDLVVVELAINSQPVTAEGLEADGRKRFESLLRSTLQLPGKPAILILNYYTWWHAYRGTVKCHGSYYGDRGSESSEEGMSLIAKYYDIPVLSMKTAVYPLMAAGIEPFRADKIGNLDAARRFNYTVNTYGHEWRPFFYGDAVHPNENGHRALADLLVHTVTQYMGMEDSCRIGTKGLPPFMIRDNYDAKGCACLLNPFFFLIHDQSGQLVETKTTQDGFHYGPQFPERPLRMEQKWGWIATEPEAWLAVEVPFCRPDLRKKESQPVFFNVAYIRSYENFGTAHVTCSSGCQCQGMRLLGIWSDKSTQTDVASLKVLYEPDSVACTIHIKNLKETVSGGHKFVVMYIQVQMPRTEQAEPRKAWREWLGIS